MDGQLYQLCSIAASARKSLQDKYPFSYASGSYEGKVEFHLLPSKRFLSFYSFKIKGLGNWLDYCLKKGLRDIKLIMPLAVKDLNTLGFSNGSNSFMMCFYHKTVTCLYPKWEFDSTEKKWNILYTEYQWKNPSLLNTPFENNTESFKTVLAEIKELAITLESQFFAQCFDNAHRILSGTGNDIDATYGLPLPPIPEKNMPLFKAAWAADVFGAMGSWNDSPPYIAHDKGLQKEYKTLSNELLRQMRLALSYAINESY